MLRKPHSQRQEVATTITSTARRATTTTPQQLAASAPETSLVNRGGRPRKATGRDLLIEICARVATGETLTAIAKESGMPSPPVFRAAVAKDSALGQLWREAKLERPHALFDEALDLARQLRDTTWGKEDGNTVRAKQVAIDALRTAAGRLSPREYGERPAQNVVVPVQINTTLALEPGKTPPKPRNEYHYEATALADSAVALSDLASSDA